MNGNTPPRNPSRSPVTVPWMNLTGKICDGWCDTVPRGKECFPDGNGGGGPCDETDDSENSDNPEGIDEF